MNAPKLNPLKRGGQVRDVDLLKFSTVRLSTALQTSARVVFYVLRLRFLRLFFPVRFVAKRYILQQKCLNGQIGTCLLRTRWYNF